MDANRISLYTIFWSDSGLDSAMVMSPHGHGAETLTLAEAETLAISNDPSVESVKSRQVALNELEVAAGQLPDPQLKFGLMSLPTDTFNLGQEPMTQVQVGVVQRFPRGQSRELRAAQLRERSKALGDTAEDLLLASQVWQFARTTSKF